MLAVRELRDVDARTFRDHVATVYEPVVMRGLVRDWPAVTAGLDSPAAAIHYLKQFDNGNPVDAILMRPETRGEIGYDDAMQGFNFVRNRLPVSTICEQLTRYGHFEVAPALAVQSALTDECLPGFASGNPLSVLASQVRPRIWFGNRVTVPAHFDESNNVACV